MELEEGVFAAEKIVQQKITKGKKLYLVKWVGCPPEENTWEPAKNIFDKRLITAFEQLQQRSPVKRGRKPKQVVQQQSHTERQVLPFRGGHTHNRAVSSSSSSSSCSSDDAENNDSTRGNRSSASSENSSTSSSSEDDDDESEEEKPKKGVKARGKPRQEPPARKSASLSAGGIALCGARSTNSPLKEKSPIRESLKRKAEVIQESGKIGVTITTTPKTSPTAGNGSSLAAFGQDAVEAASNLLSLKHGTPINVSHALPSAKVARTASNASAGSGSGLGTGTGKVGRPNRAAAAAAAAAASNGTRMQNGTSHSHAHTNSEPDALPAEFWMTKQPLADQIVLTDVTVNLTTVTVRECKTKDEFFKGAAGNGITSVADDSKPQTQAQLKQFNDAKH